LKFAAPYTHAFPQFSPAGRNLAGPNSLVQIRWSKFAGRNPKASDKHTLGHGFVLLVEIWLVQLRWSKFAGPNSLVGIRWSKSEGQRQAHAGAFLLLLARSSCCYSVANQNVPTVCSVENLLLFTQLLLRA
jgi:hypothetical protein